MVKRPGPAWVPCPGCGNYWCRLHQQHAYDCPCPAVEDWPVDPYTTGGPPLFEPTRKPKGRDDPGR